VTKALIKPQGAPELPAFIDPEVFQRKVEEAEQELRGKMSPPGALGLPPLLDQRRLERGICDAAFKYQAAFDRILVSQYDEEAQRDTYLEGGKIIKTSVAKQRDTMQAPRGVIISAGLRALDNLRSNGIDLGHQITFVRVAPYRITVDWIAGVEMSLLVLRDGDVIASLDTMEALRVGKASVQSKDVADQNGNVITQHFYVDGDGKSWAPQIPWVADDA
jgi:hypothetical protein